MTTHSELAPLFPTLLCDRSGPQGPSQAPHWPALSCRAPVSTTSGEGVGQAARVPRHHPWKEAETQRGKGLASGHTAYWGRASPGVLETSSPGPLAWGYSPDLACTLL